MRTMTACGTRTHRRRPAATAGAPSPPAVRARGGRPPRLGIGRPGVASVSCGWAPQVRAVGRTASRSSAMGSPHASQVPYRPSARRASAWSTSSSVRSASARIARWSVTGPASAGSGSGAFSTARRYRSAPGPSRRVHPPPRGVPRSSVGCGDGRPRPHRRRPRPRPGRTAGGAGRQPPAGALSRRRTAAVPRPRLRRLHPGHGRRGRAGGRLPPLVLERAPGGGLQVPGRHRGLRGGPGSGPRRSPAGPTAPMSPSCAATRPRHSTSWPSGWPGPVDVVSPPWSSTTPTCCPGPGWPRGAGSTAGDGTFDSTPWSPASTPAPPGAAGHDRRLQRDRVAAPAGRDLPGRPRAGGTRGRRRAPSWRRTARCPPVADFVAFSGHKLYAPFGAGALIGPRPAFDRR